MADASPVMDASSAATTAADAAGASSSSAASGAKPKQPPTRSQMMLATLRALLKKGARVTARDNFGMTALHHAARAGHVDACLFLLSLNTEMRLPRAPIEAETNAEERPLHLAAAGGHADTVRTLLKQGAHPGRTNYLGQTALHLGVSGGDTPEALATVAELVKPEWRIDLSAGQSDGATPLHLAARGGHNKMVGQLLHARNVRRTSGGRSVELEPKDKKGRTPADLARAESFDDIAALLEEAIRAAAERKARAPEEEDRLLRQAFAETRLESARRPSAGRELQSSGPTSMEEVLPVDEEDLGD